jgi:hypothetical protein
VAVVPVYTDIVEQPSSSVTITVAVRAPARAWRCGTNGVVVVTRVLTPKSQS